MLWAAVVCASDGLRLATSPPAPRGRFLFFIMQGDKEFKRWLRKELAGGKTITSLRMFEIMPIEFGTSPWWFRFRLSGMEGRGVIERAEDNRRLTQVKWRLKNEKKNPYARKTVRAAGGQQDDHRI